MRATSRFAAYLRPDDFQEELECRRIADAVFSRDLLFRQLIAVEVGHLARADDVELQDLEIRAHELGDVAAGEIDEMGLPAVRAAPELPHHGEPLSLPGRLVEVVAQ